MMPSWWQLLLVVLLAVLLFGRGKISSMMGDVAKGINAFKKGMKDGAEDAAAEERRAIDDEKIVDVSASDAKQKQRYEG